jgi:hypothetical protein
MTIRRARGILSLFWIASSCPLILLLGLQTAVNKYGDDWDLAWAWLSPLVFPILSIVIAVWTLSDDPAGDKPVRSRSMFWGTMCLCAFYMVMLWGILLIEPTSELSWTDLMKRSGWFLGLFQGVVAGAIAKFFIENVH